MKALPKSPFRRKKAFPVGSVSHFRNIVPFATRAVRSLSGHRQFRNFVYRKYTTVANIKAFFKNINSADKDRRCCHISRVIAAPLSRRAVSRGTTHALYLFSASVGVQTAVSTVIARENSAYAKNFTGLIG